jgi:hypothetical protein
MPDADPGPQAPGGLDQRPARLGEDGLQRGGRDLPADSQHRDSKAEGISYEENYKGNALAAMLAPGRIEVRFHAAYTPDEVAGFLAGAFSTPELAELRAWSVTYKGKPLNF